MGGYGVLTDQPASGPYFMKTYHNIKPHKTIYYSFTLYTLDTLDGVEHFDIEFDGYPVSSWMQSALAWKTTSICGLSTIDVPNYRVFGGVAHLRTALSSLVLRFVSHDTQISTDESYGFRDLRLLFSSNTATPSMPMCATAPIQIPSSHQCKCPEGEYADASGCHLCNSLCVSCFGPSMTECYQCIEGAGFDGSSCIPCGPLCAVCDGSSLSQCTVCDAGLVLFKNEYCMAPLLCYTPLSIDSSNPCGSPICSSPCETPYFLYWDMTCSLTCDPPLQQVINTDYHQVCKYPCTSGYLYWDGSCQSSCLLPLKTDSTHGSNLCTFPCPIDNFLYWDQSCSALCPLPLIQTTLYDRHFCNYPCSGTLYLYWDGSCDVCDPPLSQRIANGKNFCDFLCDQTQFLYWDGSCSYYCNPPLLQSTQGKRKFCHYPCLASQTLYWDGTCDTTSSCAFPLIPRSEASLNYCSHPCSISDFLYIDGSCLSHCDLPLLQRVKGAQKFCDSPCLGTGYLYWDDSCDSMCSPPLTPSIRNGMNHCSHKCLFDQYLYWNGTCSDVCDSPLKRNPQKGKKFCNFPCIAGQSLYWNGTCSGTCTSPLLPRIVGSDHFCDKPCLDMKYLYWNTSCLANCDLPFSKRNESGNLYCDYPCTSLQYLYWNGICKNSCLKPFLTIIQNSLQYCYPPCPLQEYLYNNSICINLCRPPLIYKIQEFGQACYPPCANGQYYYPETKQCKFGCPEFLRSQRGLYPECLRPHTTPILRLVRTLQHAKFFLVDMPPRIDTISVHKGRNILSILSLYSMPQFLEKNFVQHSLPYAFDKSGFPSDFSVNIWPDFSAMMIALLFGLLFLALEIGIKTKFPGSHRIEAYRKLRTTFLFNLPIALFANSIDNIILFTSLEFRATDFSIAGSISFIVCITALVLAVIFLACMLYLLLRGPKNLVEDQVSGTRVVKAELWPFFMVLYRSFRQDTILRRTFYFSYLVKIILSTLITAILYSYPVFQAMLYLVLSIATLCFIAIIKPFKKKINYVQLLIVESIVLGVNVCLITLAGLNSAGLQRSRAAVLFGDLIIFGNLCINLNAIVFLVIKISKEAKKIYKARKGELEASRERWIQIMMIGLQQGLFGFEEMFDDIGRDEYQEQLDISQRRNNIRNVRDQFDRRAQETISMDQASQVDASAREQSIQVTDRARDVDSFYGVNMETVQR